MKISQRVDQLKKEYKNTKEGKELVAQQKELNEAHQSLRERAESIGKKSRKNRHDYKKLEEKIAKAQDAYAVKKLAESDDELKTTSQQNNNTDSTPNSLF